MSRNVTGVKLEDLGDVVTLPEYCGLYRECETKVRQQLKAGTCRVPPAMAHPTRWRKSDLELDILGASAVADRKRRAKSLLKGPMSTTAPDRCAAAHVRKGSSAGVAADGHEPAPNLSPGGGA